VVRSCRSERVWPDLAISEISCVTGCTGWIENPTVDAPGLRRTAAVSGTKGAVSSLAPMNSCADGIGERAKSPRPATALLRLPTSSSSVTKLVGQDPIGESVLAA